MQQDIRKGFYMKIIIALLIFSIIILFHELGHFLLAKANGTVSMNFHLD